MVAATLPAASVANLLSLPARHFAVVDAGSHRARILLARVARGRPRVVGSRCVDAHEDGLTSAEEMHEAVRQLVRDSAPEAVVLVLPQHQTLRHLLDVPPGEAGQTRALVEREASSIGGLSESQWAFDAVRLRSFGRLANPLAAAFCRQDALQALLEGCTDDPNVVFDVRPAGDALAAGFRAVCPGVMDALLVDLGAGHTALTILVGGQAVFSASFPLGSSSFTEGVAADRPGTTLEAAEILKRTEPPALDAPDSPHWSAAVASWRAELERAVAEWASDQPELGAAAAAWPVFLTGGGALQPGLTEGLSSLGGRRFEPWPLPSSGGGPPRSDYATAWGALLLALGLSGPAPSLLPAEQRQHWNQQRVWRGLVSLNLVLAGLVAVAIAGATWHQRQVLADKQSWKEAASRALQQAQHIRVVTEGLNARMESFRPVLERQRQTVETLQVLGVLQQQRTNSAHWYVLLADAASYAVGSNDLAALPPTVRPVESRGPPGSAGVATNAAVSARTFVAEVCLVPQGEAMRQALSELVADLKRYPPFRNVDVLPSERRREWVATNLIFPERHFALELNLSDSELLSPFPLPRLSPTNREPRGGLRLPGRGTGDSAAVTNGARAARSR